ncbi:sulfite oxidase [Salsipaludibacter albus]|uniref:sulfite oxidase n=1 Tax=Salsipaludibacter albus TaxID=2849650 RepID=UPI001EE4527B|nr:sulfite oxidase [Salsipaludibacter albus]MBY5163544.1 sulfite oxidase [Salsipaludibacter albus]
MSTVDTTGPDTTVGTTPATRPAPGRAAAALAGAVGAGLALGLTELFAGLLDGMPSLVDAVAAQVVAILPGDLLTWGIETFGERDRLVIGLGVVVVVLAVGAAAGLMARTGRGGEAGALFVAFGLIGIVSALGDVATIPWVTTIAVVVAVAAGFGATWVLVAGRRGDGMLDVVRSDGREPVALDRRTFLAAAGAVGGVAALAGVGGRLLGRPPAVDPDAASLAEMLPDPVSTLPPAPAAASLDVDGLTPLFVPNEDFYRIDTALTGAPRVDVATWRLRIHGLVERERSFSFEELVDRGLVESDVTIACVSNEVGGGLVGNARWTGVPLAPLLDEVGVLDGGTQLVGRAVDDFTVGFPTEIARDGRDAMIAVAMNGEPLPVAHGFPARLIVPGLYGYVSATKWLSDIELTGWDDFDAYWVPRGWSKEGPVKTQARIDTPGEGAGVAAGDVTVAGVAWAPTRGIEAVEVRVDDGAWQEATLSEPLDDDTWVQWQLPVALEPGGHRLAVRATDGTGQTQPEERTAPHPNGAQGWHTVQVDAA